VLDKILLALQAFQVLFLLIHDWMPLGRLNDVAAVRSQDTLGRLVRVTAIQTIPFAIGPYFSARYFGAGYPHWLVMWLWISYALLFIGQFRAWWVPYLLKPEPKRASAIASCLAIPTRSSRNGTEWCQTPPTSFSMLPPSPRWSFSSLKVFERSLF
jgi:hypothetical protein